MSSSYYKKGQNMAYARYELKLNSLEEFYTIYSILDELGLSSIFIDRIDRSDREQLELEIAAEAMKNARAKAEAIASADELKVGRCFEFSTPRSQTYYRNYSVDNAIVEGYSVSEKEKQFFPKIGTVKISAAVYAKFWLK